MKRNKRVAALTVALVLAGLVGWFGTKQYRCRQRNVAFSRHIEMIKKDAGQQLVIGAKKDAVARFYEAHKIPFRVVRSTDTEFEAIGTLYTTEGCAPFGCGTDDALIGVRVTVDANGTVTGKPEVVDLFTDCL